MLKPKVFVSYAWTSTDHIKWVENLARDLVSTGIEVKLDQWDIKPGDDTAHFMESIVRDPSITHVIMVCDKLYKSRADNREAGAGVEAQIITRELYESIENNKYVALLRENDDEGKPTTPIFTGRRLYIDFTDDSKYFSSHEELVRWIYNKPLKTSPPLGSRPAWLDAESGSDSPTRMAALAARREIKSGGRHLTPLLNKYLHDLSSIFLDMPNLDFSMHSLLQCDAIELLENFCVQRDEYLEVIEELGIYSADETAFWAVHSFFEQLAVACLPSTTLTHVSREQFDHKKFLAYEFFLLTTTIFIKYSRWSGLCILLHQNYAVPENSILRGKSTNFSFFYHENRVLHAHLTEKGRNTHFPVGRMLLDRLNQTYAPHEVMQADLLLYLVFKCLQTTKRVGWWFPECYAYSGAELINFPLFVKAKSRAFFGQIKILFDVVMVEEFKQHVRQIDQEGGLFKGQFLLNGPMNVGSSIGVEEIGEGP